jgi:hypothetical protein
VQVVQIVQVVQVVQELYSENGVTRYVACDWLV